MSLVPTFVRADNGKWYENPVLSRHDWFICYDDDDPIELVIRADSGIKPKDVFKKLGIEAHVIGWQGGKAQRCFTRDYKPEGMALADSYWIDIHDPIPADFITRWTNIFGKKRPTREGVYYGENHQDKELKK